MSAPIETAPKVCFCGAAIRKRTSESFIRWRERKFCSSKCNRAAQVAALDLAGTTFGKWKILERLPGRDEYEYPTWRARHHCGSESTLSSKQLSSCRSKKCEPRCEACTGLRRAAQEPKSEAICTLCANQTWRVVGPRCRRCRLEYEDEVIEVHGTGMKSNAGFC